MWAKASHQVLSQPEDKTSSFSLAARFFMASQCRRCPVRRTKDNKCTILRRTDSKPVFQQGATSDLWFEHHPKQDGARNRQDPKLPKKSNAQKDELSPVQNCSQTMN